MCRMLKKNLVRIVSVALLNQLHYIKTRRFHKMITSVRLNFKLMNKCSYINNIDIFLSAIFFGSVKKKKNIQSKENGNKLLSFRKSNRS